MKRKLKLEDLAVDTFATTPDAPRGRGTVRGLADTTPGACEASLGGTCIEETCAMDCNPSLEISCGAADTCQSMIEPPCYYFCEVTQPNFFTCGKTCMCA